MFSVGFAGHLIPDTHDLMLKLTPFTLSLLGGYAVYSLRCSSDKKFWLWVIPTYILAFFSEVIGVKTGLIFGSYSYSDVLGVKILSVPVIIGFNWVIVILGAIYTSKKITNIVYVRPIIVGIIATAFDFLMEPVAIKLKYWSWNDGSIPITNYLSWLIISVLFASYYEYLKPEESNSNPIFYLGVQIAFFLSLTIFLK